jgi:hypothetical protein
MSTKLYHAVELQVAPTLAAVEAWASPLRAPMQATAERLLAREVVRRSIQVFDSRTVRSPGAPPTSVLIETLQAVWAEQRESHYIRHPDVDMGAYCQVFFDAVTERVYGLFFIENSILAQQFLADPAVIRVPYWNNTDRPESVSEADWDARADLWDRLVGRALGCMPGVRVDLVGSEQPAGFPSDEDVRVHQPTLAERARYLAKDLTLEDILLAMQAGGEALRPSRVMDEFLTLKDDHPLVQAQTESLMTRLLPTITREALTG